MVTKDWKVGCFESVLYQLRWFAGNQIRNVACLGGNIATASPISDLNPIWVAAVSSSQAIQSHALKGCDASCCLSRRETDC